MKVTGLLLLSLSLLQRGTSSSGEDDTIQKPVDDEVYDLVEQELMKRISTPNETLFEKETNQMFIRFLIEYVKENNTAAPTLRQADQHLQSEETAQQAVQAPNDGQYNQNLYQQQQQQVPQDQQQQYPQTQQQNIQQGAPQQQQGQQQPVNWQQPGATQGAQGYPQQQAGNPAVGGQQFYPHQPVAPQQPGAAAGQHPAGTVPPYPYPYPPEAYPGAFPPTRPPETLAEVDKLIQQIFRLNITGVLDQSLSLVGSNPVRNLGGGVLKLVFCDPISRLLGRCRGSDTIARKLRPENLRFLV